MENDSQQTSVTSPAVVFHLGPELESAILREVAVLRLSLQTEGHMARTVAEGGASSEKSETLVRGAERRI